MAKLKVTLKLDPKLNKMFDRKFQNDLGRQVVTEMKKLIAKGISPVKGVPRFEAYAVQRKSAENRTVAQVQGAKGLNRKTSKSNSLKHLYPNSVKNKFPGKQARPVNLFLDGSFIDTISYKSSDNKVEVGHIDMDKNTRNLFEAHNEGLNRNVPKRKYLPNKRGEEFVASIKTLIKSIYSAKIRSILNK